MLKRKATADFLQWKASKTKQALLVVGARQVGKTTTIREFAKASYASYAEINLVDDEAALASFKQASSSDDLALRISVATSANLMPGKTAIFIDEVQECPEIVTYIKFLVDKGDYDYILSGSLLGVELENIRSWPVGYVAEMTMYPLDFKEYCWANGIGPDAMGLAQEAFARQKPVPGFLHERLTELFHRYLLIGGMPDAVASFAESSAIDQVRSIQDNITRYYERDISKYAPRYRRLVIRDIFRLIPSELSRQNRRFRLSSISQVKRFTQVQDEFLWLTQAGVALPAYNVRLPASPLTLNESRSIFKLFSSDVGLLTSRFAKKDTLGLLDGRPTAGLGGVYENYVAQELAAHGFDLRYFSSKKIGELDFVVEDKGGAVTAFEVKSGSNYKTHAALTNALNTANYQIDKAFVLAETNVCHNGAVTYLPVYMAGMFINE